MDDSRVDDDYNILFEGSLTPEMLKELDLADGIPILPPANTYVETHNSGIGTSSQAEDALLESNSQQSQDESESRSTSNEIMPNPPRKRGRPKGSRNKQPKAVKQVSMLSNAESTSEVVRRPVGRPRKQPTPHGVSIELGKQMISGSSGAPFRSHTPRDAMVTAKGTHTSMTPPQQLRSTTRTANNACIPVNQPAPSSFALPSIAPTQPVRSPWTSSGPTISSPEHLEHCIIPGEDSQREVEDDEVDADDEEVDVEDEEESDWIGQAAQDEDVVDEVDPAHGKPSVPADGSSSHCRPHRPRRPPPDWLKSEFQTKLEDSSPDLRDSKLLPLYRDHHTFWFPRPSSYFVLKRSSISPQDLLVPRFFLWDPAALCDIPCPNCKTKLNCHAYIPYPRRCVDLCKNFWIIGYRYRCPTCRHPTSKKYTITFQSWDSRILAKLPRSLAAEFPARLSHRSGISNVTFAMMRSAFQNGMGPKQFADALRVQHLQRYEELHVQYLHELVTRQGLAEWRGKKFIDFLPFDDRSLQGPHGFTPSPRWLRDMYDKLIEEHSSDFRQHTAMLSADICAIDHSHKITKHIARVNGVQVFTAVLSMTNRDGQLRICDLVATKSHSQFELAMQQMDESLDLYGLPKPLAFYTDATLDRHFLETCLEPLSLPDDVHVFVKSTTLAIDDAIRTILEALSPDDDTMCIAVSFDSEWNVEMTTDGHIVGRGKTAVIQIAYEKRVYILQISGMLAEDKLPHQFKLLLAHPRVLKVSRMVNAVLQYLEAACGTNEHFTGGVELAKYAKERLVVPTATCSLSDLAAAVLKKRLDKKVTSQVSMSWENDNLSMEQSNYAALDAYASLAIFDALSEIDVPKHLPPGSLIPNTPIILYNDDNTRVIAHGHLSGHLSSLSFGGISITSSRTAVDVTEILVPGAIVRVHGKRALRDFGTLPFTVVCLRSHVRISPAGESKSLHQSPHYAPPPILRPLFPHPEPATEADSETNLTIPDGPSIGALVLETDVSETSEVSMSSHADSHSRYADPSSVIEGNEILDPVPTEWNTNVRTRVMKDLFHVFNMFYISAAHGLRREFASASQLGLLRSIHLKHGIVLFEAVLRGYGDIANGSSPHRNNFTLLSISFLSDPPGVALFTTLGVDKKAGGLPIYRCCRGTNFTEGGVHTHLCSHLPSSGASIRHVHASLLDFVLQHNLLVGTFNTTGQCYRGHPHQFMEDYRMGKRQSLCRNFEVIGILPIPDDIQTSCGMAPFEASLDSKQQHHFLAHMHNTRKPVLPIHTVAERNLFSSLMREHEAFNVPSGVPRWKDAVKVWNRYADENVDIFYKAQQLTVFHSDWKTSLNVRETLSLSLTARKPVLNVIQNPRRSALAPAIPQHPLKPHQVNEGFLAITDGSPEASTSTAHASGSMSTLTAEALAHKQVAESVLDSRPVKKH
ncbi:hypothetical protein Hypma_003473 [Hypsizygus marmoreus]|uniref:3'-5' exonuclease n=1 Tax=Hypsizygus marmoreus TaxID=39966 RepID=A0A369J226_HYPMA|nr:hypothetical protein Hypma_003473 [Hypsizygus marmoreus]